MFHRKSNYKRLYKDRATKFENPSKLEFMRRIFNRIGERNEFVCMLYMKNQVNQDFRSLKNVEN